MPSAPTNGLPPRPKRGGLRRAATLILFILCGYGLLAYIVLPELWPRGNHPEPAGDRGKGSNLACDRQCHGEIAPDAAIAPSKSTEQSAFFAALHCFAALAMTALIEYYPASI